MKKIFKILCVALAGALLSQNASAQESFGSAGLEIALPMGDISDAYGIGIGGSGAFEIGLSDKLAATVNAGIVFWSIKSDVSDFIKSAYTVPLQAGLRYYLKEQRDGLFFEAQLGFHLSSVTTEDIDYGLGVVPGETDSSTDFSFAPQVGYFLTEKISLAARYQIITGEDDSISYLGFRLGYNF